MPQHGQFNDRSKLIKSVRTDANYSNGTYISGLISYNGSTGYYYTLQVEYSTGNIVLYQSNGSTSKNKILHTVDWDSI